MLLPLQTSTAPILGLMQDLWTSFHAVSLFLIRPQQALLVVISGW